MDFGSIVRILFGLWQICIWFAWKAVAHLRPLNTCSKAKLHQLELISALIKQMDTSLALYIRSLSIC